MNDKFTENIKQRMANHTMAEPEGLWQSIEQRLDAAPQRHKAVAVPLWVRRIGVAAAKGFAWGREIPCFGVSTLEAMALSLGIWQGYVCPVMDARRSQVYNALFHVDCGKYTKIREDRAISLRELESDLQNLREPIFLVGDGSILCYNTLSENVPSLVLPPEHRMHQRASGVALAAMRMIAAGEKTDGAELTPNYLRLSQAERERNERMQNR